MRIVRLCTLRWLVFSHVAPAPEESVIKGVAAVSGLRETSTAAEISDVAARELETAATLDLSNVQVALARVASRLFDTAVHSAEAVPALAHAIVLELRENANAVPTGESLGTTGEDATPRLMVLPSYPTCGTVSPQCVTPCARRLPLRDFSERSRSSRQRRSQAVRPRGSASFER